MVVARLTLVAAAMLLLMAASVTARADCPALRRQLDAALESKSLKDAKATEKSIYLDDACLPEDARAKDQIVSLEVDLLADVATAAATRDAILTDLRNPAGWLHDWTTAALAADRLFAQRRFAEAVEFYDRAIGLAGDPSVMTDPQKRDVIGKASAAKLLASDDDGGRREAALATTSRGVDGVLGGIFAPAMRGVVPVAIPLPVNFLYDSTAFSPVGAKATAELCDYLKQQKVTDVTLIGHTDQRGPDAYNVRLSEARIHQVASFLQQHGVTAHVTAIGRGWHDPLDVSRLPYAPDQEEVWALNRRVELLR